MERPNFFRIALEAGGFIAGVSMTLTACGGEGESSPTQILSTTPSSEAILTLTPTLTSTPTEIPTPTPTPTETPTETPTNRETPPDVKEVLDRYYLEVGDPVNTYGKTTFAVSKAKQNLPNVCVPDSQAGLEDCRITEVFANTENVPDAEERIDKAYSTIGLFLMWNNYMKEKTPEQQDLAITPESEEEEILQKAEEFRRRVDEGEDFTFTMAGYDETGPQTFSTDINVNPKFGVIVVELPHGDDTQITLSRGGKISYSAIDGHLIIGSYTISSRGFGHLQHPSDAFIADIEGSWAACYEIAAATFHDLDEQLKVIENIPFNAHWATFKREVDILEPLLIPNKKTHPQTEQTGAILAR